MFTKEYVREVLEQICAPYMTVPLADEYVQKIYDDFVKIRNGEAAEHSVQTDVCQECGETETIYPNNDGVPVCVFCGTRR